MQQDLQQGLQVSLQQAFTRFEREKKVVKAKGGEQIRKKFFGSKVQN